MYTPVTLVTLYFLKVVTHQGKYWFEFPGSVTTVTSFLYKKVEYNIYISRVSTREKSTKGILEVYRKVVLQL